MGIQADTGLVSGIPINKTVDQLMAISAQPRNRLQTRNTELQQRQIAIGELTAMTIAIQLSADRLADESVYQQRVASSSADEILAAAVTGDAVAGQYEFTPVRTAQNHQSISSGVASLEDALGSGEVSLRFGGFVDQAVDLDLLNGGEGVERGKIRITDRSGASQIVDLRFAMTVDDVLQAINSSEDINVTAVAEGDSISLLDQTGQIATNLKVQEVGLGTTAADLGLAGIDVGASQATGQDILRLFEGLNLQQLNDGTGVRIREELPDLEIQFRDGSDPLEISLSATDITDVGDLIDALNAADPSRFSAELAADGDRLVLHDLTVDAGGTFAVSSPVGGSLAEDLGLTGTAVAGEITGARLFGSLNSPLLSDLAGGTGLGPLGQVSLTDRSGGMATVDLSSSETLDDVVRTLNGSGLALQARINDARNGILLTDTSGVTSSNLIVANADATNSADQLQLAIDAAQTRVDSGSLNLQVVHAGTRLDSLNKGEGVALGSFLITDTTGNQSGLNLLTSEAETVGDVMDLINSLSIAVEARINDTGDGILLVDTAGGSGKITVTESGSKSTAADLGLLGESELIEIDGSPTQVIDGATTASFQIEDGDTLEDLVAKINDAEMGVTASIFQSGSGQTPYRLALSSSVAGQAGEMLIDASQLGLDFQTIVTAQDALLQVGSANVPGAGVLVTSDSNRFEDVISGVQLTLNGVSETPISIEVKATDKKLVSNVEMFVKQYNSLHKKLDELTFFNEESGKKGILFGSNETLRVETTLTRLVTDRFLGVGEVQSLEQVGIQFKDDGSIELDKDKFTKQFADDPESVEQLFADSEIGFAAKMNAAIETLAGEENSLLVNRNQALQRKIETNSDRIEFLNERLENERERLLQEFYAMEVAIARIQSNMSAVNSIAALTPLSQSSNKK